MSRILLIKLCRLTPYFQVTQPLGLMYIAAVLRKDDPCREIRIVDMKLHRWNVKDILPQVRSFDPHIVGIQALTLEAEILHAVAREVKRIKPLCRVIVGGPHASTMPVQILSDPNVDALVLGEGEYTGLRVVQALEKGEPLEGIPGGAYRRKDGSAHMEGPAPFIENLDELPFPAWDLIEVEKYFKRLPMNALYARKERMSVFSSRGCPYGCSYCHNIFGKRFRPRSPQNVFQEIETLYREHGIREIHFLDDVFNLDMNRAKAICDRIIGSGIDITITFPNGIRGDIMDEELLFKLKKAGTFRITYGVESASPRIQRMIQKNLDLKKLEEVVALTDKMGVLCNGFFMLGFPTETREEMEQTLRFMKECRFHSCVLFHVNPFPGTRLWDSLPEKVRRDTEKARKFDYFRPHFEASLVPRHTVERLITLEKIRFYLNPRRGLRFFLLMPNKRQFVVLGLHFLYRFLASTLRILFLNPFRKMGPY